VGIAFALMLVCLGAAGWILKLAPIFYVVLILTGGFLIHQIVRLRKKVSPTESFALFKQHVWVGLAILGGIWLGCVS